MLHPKIQIFSFYKSERHHVCYSLLISMYCMLLWMMAINVFLLFGLKISSQKHVFENVANIGGFDKQLC